MTKIVEMQLEQLNLYTRKDFKSSELSAFIKINC